MNITRTKIEQSNIEKNLKNVDCNEFMKTMEDNCVDLSLTDIPYNAVNRKGELRVLDKEKADILTFNLQDFLSQLFRVTKGTIIVFCGKEQFSEIYHFFSKKAGTVRPIVWEKTNPSPMNGEYVYLSGVEFAVWFKKRGRKFNAFCKNSVFRHPNGRSKFHPIEKNHNLLRELILDNSNETDIVFDPCFGSGAHLIVARSLNRKILGCEIEQDYFEIGKNRILSSSYNVKQQ